MTNPKIIAATLAASLIALSALPAQAGQRDTVDFKFRAHEVETKVGAKIVYKRMRNKAESACDALTASKLRSPAILACEADLLNDWVREADNAQLTRLHRARGTARIAQYD